MYTLVAEGVPGGVEGILEKLLTIPSVFVAIFRETFVYLSPPSLERLGYSPEELKGLKVWELVPDEGLRELVRRRVRERVYEGFDESIVYPHIPLRCKDGSIFVMYAVATTVELEDGRAVLAVGFDFTKEYMEEQNLRRERTNQILSHIRDIICILDASGIIKYISPSVRSVLGKEEAKFLNSNFFDILKCCVSERDVEKLRNLFERAVGHPGIALSSAFEVTFEGRKRFFEFYMHLPKNWREVGIEGPILSVRDVTDVRLMEKKLIELRYYDAVTGLPRRPLVIEKMDKMLRISRREGHMVVVIVLDIMGFKNVNMLVGRRGGDEFLRTLADRLKESLRESDLIGRLEGDRFLIVFSGVGRIFSLERLLEKIREVMRRSVVEKNGVKLELSARMGIAVFPVDGDSPDELVEKAEMALYKAKQAGKELYLFSSNIKRELERKLQMKWELKRAIDDGSLVPFYQPVVDAKGFKVVGAEALARWFHPERGLIPPKEFIPVAEETGVITDLEHYMLVRIFNDMFLIQNGKRPLWVAVNFSPRQFFDARLLNRLEEVAERFQDRTRHVVIEITEDAAIENPMRAAAVIKDIKSMGFRIAIDDFGKGYSYLSYLVKLDVDKVKIDKLFVDQLVEDAKVRKVVKAMVELAHSIGAQCVAEGVERREMVEILSELGCDELQGFYFARPMGLDALRRFLKKREAP